MNPDANRPVPEIGTFPKAEIGDEPGLPRRPGLRRGPPAGWRVATVASSFLLLSVVAGMASLLAGTLLLLPLALLAAPFFLRRKLRRKNPQSSHQSGGWRRHSSIFQPWGGKRSMA
jgi:hypothetical protein